MSRPYDAPEEALAVEFGSRRAARVGPAAAAAATAAARAAILSSPAVAMNLPTDEHVHEDTGVENAAAKELNDPVVEAVVGAPAEPEANKQWRRWQPDAGWDEAGAPPPDARAPAAAAWEDGTQRGPSTWDTLSLGFGDDAAAPAEAAASGQWLGTEPAAFSIEIRGTPGSMLMATVTRTLGKHGLDLDWERQQEDAERFVRAVSESMQEQVDTMEAAIEREFDALLFEATQGFARLEDLANGSLLGWQQRLLGGPGGILIGGGGMFVGGGLFGAGQRRLQEDKRAAGLELLRLLTPAWGAAA